MTISDLYLCFKLFETYNGIVVIIHGRQIHKYLHYFDVSDDWWYSKLYFLLGTINFFKKIIKFADHEEAFDSVVMRYDSCLVAS